MQLDEVYEVLLNTYMFKKLENPFILRPMRLIDENVLILGSALALFLRNVIMFSESVIDRHLR